jgi:hypothetical protein
MKPPDTTLDGFVRAAAHPIAHATPAPDFFAGALLGNGGLGAVVTTRPDAIAIRFGHNSVWDIRVAEDHADEIGTFQEIFARVKAIPADYERLDQDPWFREYAARMAENYSRPYPRPFPCGSLILGFDRRRVELLGHSLDISTGRCDVSLIVDGNPATVEIFVEPEADRLWLRVVDQSCAPLPTPFDRVRLLPDPDGLLDDAAGAGGGMFTALASLDETTIAGGGRTLGRGLTAPADQPADTLSFRQRLPARRPAADGSDPHDPRDRAFRVAVRCSTPLEQRSRMGWHGTPVQQGPLERTPAGAAPFLACVQLDEGLASVIDEGAGTLAAPGDAAFARAVDAARAVWQEYWRRSAVALDDALLERVWYTNHYFLRCALRPGVTCPGLFANWSYRRIGAAWHGDYHMNYNTQQPFWGLFAANRADLHLPYVDLVDHLLPLSRAWARDYYGLRGAYFPHSAYPTEMTIMPYPAPTWGWEICETPWTVQSLWWHYVYTLDADFLAQRAFVPIREAVLFLTDYMRRPEARGPQWGDDNYHIFPTVPPELYGLMPGFRNNYDCLVDLTLTRFVFGAFLEACAILGCEEEEADLIAAVRDILAHFPPYPTAETPQGKVFVSVPGEDPQVVYNVPNPAMTVFPGEEHGLHSPPEEFAIAAASYRNQQNEGGNDLVFANLQGARLGLLDLERFKRQIAYCMLPNGACTDMVLQVHGRYSDTLAFDFMAPMGIWLENFALPAVINECLLQSYNGEVRLFPNWPLAQRAEFRTLRAVGALLVSALCDAGTVQWIEVTSERGAPLRIHVPWEAGAVVMRNTGDEQIGSGLQEIMMGVGETLRLVTAS